MSSYSAYVLDRIVLNFLPSFGEGNKPATINRRSSMIAIAIVLLLVSDLY
ncbi:hypothetical protein Hdeb2414_s0005g00172461 [Helianthus debilis subsp. tardiflorus]